MSDRKSPASLIQKYNPFSLCSSLEEKGKMEEALKCYERCLEMTPFHEEALSSIEYVRSRLANGGGKGCLTDGLFATKAQGVKDTLKQLLGSEQAALPKEEGGGSTKKKKKEKKWVNECSLANV